MKRNRFDYQGKVRTNVNRQGKRGSGLSETSKSRSRGSLSVPEPLPVSEPESWETIRKRTAAKIIPRPAAKPKAKSGGGKSKRGSPKKHIVRAKSDAPLKPLAKPSRKGPLSTKEPESWKSLRERTAAKSTPKSVKVLGPAKTTERKRALVRPVRNRKI